MAATDSSIKYEGRLPPAEVLNRMARARYLLFTSTWYEGMPRTIVESLSVGTPVICPRLGAMKSMVTHGVTGFMFAPNDTSDLESVLAKASSVDASWESMSLEATKVYERFYGPEQNRAQLEKHYTDCIDPKKQP